MCLSALWVVQCRKHVSLRFFVSLWLTLTFDGLQLGTTLRR